MLGSLWNRHKSKDLDFLHKSCAPIFFLKHIFHEKNLIRKKYFFIKKIRKILVRTFGIPLKICKGIRKILTKISKFSKNNFRLFRKIFFRQEIINIFWWFFLNHLLIHENQDKAISERFRQFKNTKTPYPKVLNRN